jgi:hypothetical protein
MKIKNNFKAGGDMNPVDILSIILLTVLITIIVAIIVKLHRNNEFRKKRNIRFLKNKAFHNATQ